MNEKEIQNIWKPSDRELILGITLDIFVILLGLSWGLIESGSMRVLGFFLFGLGTFLIGMIVTAKYNQ